MADGLGLEAVGPWQKAGEEQPARERWPQPLLRPLPSERGGRGMTVSFSSVPVPGEVLAHSVHSKHGTAESRRLGCSDCGQGAWRWAPAGGSWAGVCKAQLWGRQHTHRYPHPQGSAPDVLQDSDLLGAGGTGSGVWPLQRQETPLHMGF